MARPHPRRPRFSRPAQPWFWLLALAFLLKAATPLLAAAAASAQGVALAEVCSVYGVRTVRSDVRSNVGADLRSDGLSEVLSNALSVSAPQGSDEAPSAGLHADERTACALTLLLGSAPLPQGTTAPPLQAARQRPTGCAPTAAPSPHDASQRWLNWRLHAPPWPV